MYRERERYKHIYIYIYGGPVGRWDANLVTQTFVWLPSFFAWASAFSGSQCLACCWSTEVGVGQFASDRDAVTSLPRNLRSR